MKIIALNVGRLINSKHINFMLFVKTGLSMFLVIGENFATVVESFLDAYEEENDVYLKHLHRFLTEEISNADVLRDKAFRRLRDVLKSILLGADEAQSLAARKLLSVIDLYGGTNIPSMAVDAKSGQLTNLIEDFELEYPELVTQTDTEQLVAGLKSANDNFLRLMSERTQHIANYGKEAVRKARKKTDLAYRNLVNAINIAVDNGMAAELAPFIRYMNAEIDRYRVGLGQSAGSTSESEEEGEETIPTKTATFNFANGNVLKIKGEVGSLLVTPENTVGYHWEPEVPETMPKKNTSYVEVLDSGDEATAMFHFADHREEEIRQLVGSLLTAPDNTVGYVWKPAVPETMPAEDTSYYEIAIPGEEEEEEERPKYRITFRADGRVVATQEYHEGETIVPPECPEGFEWPDDLPEVMPARNLVIIGVEVDG